MAEQKRKKRGLLTRLSRYGRAGIEIAQEHYEYRKQILVLAKSDIVRTYRGSALGWAWAVIKPCVTIFVYWFAFSIGLRRSSDVSGYPFFLWLIAGIIPWFYISEMLTQGSNALNRYNYLVTKIRYPVSTISTFMSMSKFFIHVFLLSAVMLIFMGFGHFPDIYFLQLPLYMFLLFVFFTAWSMFASPLSAVSKDFSNVVNSFVMAIFWLSGIMWDAHRVDILWLRRLLMFNPVTFLANGYRNVFVYKKWFFEDGFALLAFCTTLTLMILAAVYTQTKLRKEIADYL